jgi:hypothetical protein
MTKLYKCVFFSLLSFNAAYCQSKIITTGNNLINFSDPKAADIVIGSDEGTRHDGSIMFWSNSSASRISNNNDVFFLSVWNTSNSNIALSAIPGGSSWFQGNVGIGNTNPQNRLDVDITSNTEQKRVSIFTNTGNNAVNSPVGGIRFNWYGTNNAEIQMVRGYGASDGAGLSFHTSNDGGVANERMRIDKNGNVSIGTNDPKGYKFAVAGSVIATSVTVKLQGEWGDYVFKPNYHLPTLKEVKSYIDKNQHLPELPSAEQITTDGVNLGEMNKLLVKKVEELTLYLMEQNKQMQAQRRINQNLTSRLSMLEKHQKDNVIK